MAILKFTHISEQDLDAIWLYIAQNSTNFADKFIEKIILKCQLLAEHPQIGRNRPELADEIYSFPVERYNVFYSLIGDAGIIIQRVIHSSRDLSSQMLLG